MDVEGDDSKPSRHADLSREASAEPEEIGSDLDGN